VCMCAYARESVCMFVCVYERVCVCVYERGYVRVCMRKHACEVFEMRVFERVALCVCVCGIIYAVTGVDTTGKRDRPDPICYPTSAALLRAFLRCAAWYGVAPISRLLKMISLFCKRAL